MGKGEHKRAKARKRDKKRAKETGYDAKDRWLKRMAEGQQSIPSRFASDGRR